MDERTLRMSMREHLRNDVRCKLLRDSISEKEAAARLDLSVRQVRRLKRRVAAEGPEGIIVLLCRSGSERSRPDARSASSKSSLPGMCEYSARRIPPVTR